MKSHLLKKLLYSFIHVLFILDSQFCNAYLDISHATCPLLEWKLLSWSRCMLGSLIYSLPDVLHYKVYNRTSIQDYKATCFCFKKQCDTIISNFKLYSCLGLVNFLYILKLGFCCYMLLSCPLCSTKPSVVILLIKVMISLTIWNFFLK